MVLETIRLKQQTIYNSYVMLSLLSL